jgi:hypothetical protein
MYGKHGQNLLGQWPDRTADNDVPDDCSPNMRGLYRNQQACYMEAKKAVQAMVEEYGQTCEESSTESETPEPMTPAPRPLKTLRAPSKVSNFLRSVAGASQRLYTHQPAAIGKERRAKKEGLRKERKRRVEASSESKLTQKEIEEIERLAGERPGAFNEAVERQVEERLRAHKVANATKHSTKRKCDAPTNLPNEQESSSQGASKRPRISGTSVTTNSSVPDIAVIPATPSVISPVKSSYLPEQSDDGKLMVPHFSRGTRGEQTAPIQQSASKVRSASEIAAAIAQHQQMRARHALARKIGDPHRARPHIGMFTTPPKPNMFKQSAESNARPSLSEVHGTRQNNEPAQPKIDVCNKIPDPVEPEQHEPVLPNPADTDTVTMSPLAPATFRASKKIDNHDNL